VYRVTIPSTSRYYLFFTRVLSELRSVKITVESPNRRGVAPSYRSLRRHDLLLRILPAATPNQNHVWESSTHSYEMCRESSRHLARYHAFLHSLSFGGRQWVAIARANAYQKRAWCSGFSYHGLSSLKTSVCYHCSISTLQTFSLSLISFALSCSTMRGEQYIRATGPRHRIQLLSLRAVSHLAIPPA